MADRPLAVVTGASSGIGAAFATALAARKMDLVVIARRQDRLEALKNLLERRHGIVVTTVRADLTDPAALDAVESSLAAQAVDVLVNSAGFGTYADFTSIAPERLKRELYLDLVVPVSLSRAVLPGMLARKNGLIINVSSMAGFLPIPRHSTYCAAKAGLTRFTEALHGELVGTGVRIQALCPGPVQTEFFAISGYPAEEVPSYLMQSVEDCLSSALRAMQTKDVVYFSSSLIAAFVGVMRRLPLKLRVRILGRGPTWLNGSAPQKAP